MTQDIADNVRKTNWMIRGFFESHDVNWTSSQGSSLLAVTSQSYLYNESQKTSKHRRSVEFPWLAIFFEYCYVSVSGGNQDGSFTSRTVSDFAYKPLPSAGYYFYFFAYNKITIVSMALAVGSVYLSSKLWNLWIIVGTPKFVCNQYKMKVTLGTPKIVTSVYKVRAVLWMTMLLNLILANSLLEEICHINF